MTGEGEAQLTKGASHIGDNALRHIDAGDGPIDQYTFDSRGNGISDEATTVRVRTADSGEETAFAAFVVAIRH